MKQDTRVTKSIITINHNLGISSIESKFSYYVWNILCKQFYNIFLLPLLSDMAQLIFLNIHKFHWQVFPWLRVSLQFSTIIY